MRFLRQGGLETEGQAKIRGAWVAAQTGRGFAIVETGDAQALYGLCPAWSDFGEVQVTPVVSAEEV